MFSGAGPGPRCESRATLTRLRPVPQVLYAADCTCRVGLRHMRWLAPLALASSLAALALVVPGIASATSLPGAPGKIVFTSGRANSDDAVNTNDANARLWVVDWPGGTPVQLTHHTVPQQHRHPNW